MQKKIGCVVLVAGFLASNMVLAQGSKPLSVEVQEVKPGFEPPHLSEIRKTHKMPTGTVEKPEQKAAEKPASPKSKAERQVITSDSTQDDLPGLVIAPKAPAGSAAPLAPVGAPPAMQIASTSLAAAAPVDVPPVLVAVPGQPLSIPIAIGVLNRIVTPFEDAVVQTAAAEGKPLSDGPVILIAPGDAQPLSIVVSEKVDPKQAMLITLVPTQMAARDVTVQIQGFQPKKASSDGSKAGSSNTQDAGSPRATRIKGLMRDLAKGRIPSGFSLGKGSGAAAPCTLPGFMATEAQLLTSSTLSIKVFSVLNLSTQDNELDPRGCSNPEHIGSAAWPLSRLRPGEKTELYLMVDTTNRESDLSARPSAIQ